MGVLAKVLGEILLPLLFLFCFDLLGKKKEL
jgi:hypothetical protein